MTRAGRLVLLPLGLVLLIWFSILSRHRLIDADEGFYLLASRLVFQHKVPYLDFLYTQMPLLPYVYGLWMRFAGETWQSARWLSACLTTILGLLVYLQASAETKKWTAGVLAAVLFSSSTLIFAWMPIVKTYALSGLLLFIAYTMAIRLRAPASIWTLLLAGFSLGLSIEVRLYFAAVLPVFLVWIFRNPAGHSRQSAIAAFLGGVLLGTLPSLALVIADPAAYWFNNLRIHAIRSGSGLIGGFGQKVLTLIEVLIGGPVGNGLQFGLLLVTGAVLRKRMTEPIRLAFHLALVLTVVSLAPTPTYGQYFSVVLPFLLLAAVCSADEFLDRSPARRIKKWLAAGCVIAAYIAVSVADFRRYLRTGEAVDGIYVSQNAPNWTMPNVVAVSQFIDELAAPGERVMSFWTGYIFQSKADPYPGFENETGRRFADALNPAEWTRYHIASPSRIEADIAARTPRIVVVGNQEYWHQSQKPYELALARSGYTITRRIAGAAIYTCCGAERP